jgi:hypothetical protein
MQGYAKDKFQSDLDALEHNLKVQYVALMVGVTFVFALGGA